MTNISSLYYERALSSINQINKYSQTTEKTSTGSSDSSKSSSDSFGPAFNISIGQSSSAVTGISAYDSSGRGGMTLTNEQKQIIDEVFAKYLGDSSEAPTKETMDKIREELAASGIEMPKPPPRDDAKITLTEEEQAIVDEVLAKYLEEVDGELTEEDMKNILDELESKGVSLKGSPPPPPPMGGGMPPKASDDEDDEEDETSNIVNLLDTSEDEEDVKNVLLELLEQYSKNQTKNVSSTSLDFLASLV